MEEKLEKAVEALMKEYFVVMYLGDKELPYRKELFNSIRLALEFKQKVNGTIFSLNIVGGLEPINDVVIV